MGIETLEGKLYGVAIGDIVHLFGEKGAVAGYVTHYDAKQVTLSHEDPFHQPPGLVSNIGRLNFGRGDKSYLLCTFQGYKVVVRREQDTSLDPDRPIQVRG